MTRRNKDSGKDSGTITLNFSETIQVQGGDLEIDLDISARVFIQKPMYNADNPDDYQGYWELECSSYLVDYLGVYNELGDCYVTEDWEKYKSTLDDFDRTFLLEQIKSQVSRVIYDKIEV